ncbi:MAG: hypothetical protein M1115_06840 [Actinobacteria bacterium]|nr:hypothetical protein [Actinomycetota bacterium]
MPPQELAEAALCQQAFPVAPAALAAVAEEDPHAASKLELASKLTAISIQLRNLGKLASAERSLCDHTTFNRDNLEFTGHVLSLSDYLGRH